MASFEISVDLVLAQEGALSSDPAGGLTMFGISSHAYPNLDIANLTREDARLIYKKDFWTSNGLTDQRLANLVFSLSVNMGKVSAIRLLQKAAGVIQDGNYGPMTEHCANAHVDVLVDLATLAVSRYVAIALAQNNPDYVKGWTRRVIECLM